MIVKENNFSLTHDIQGNITKFLCHKRVLKLNKLTDGIFSGPLKFDVIYPKAFARSR